YGAPRPDPVRLRLSPAAARTAPRNTDEFGHSAPRGLPCHPFRTGRSRPDLCPDDDDAGGLVSTTRRRRWSCAEAEGFEPPDPGGSLAFKASAFGRSATLPHRL